MNIPVNNGSVHLGHEAGKQLRQALSSAKKEIKIVTPYLDADLIRELIDFHQKKSLNIMLITTSSGEKIGNTANYDYRNELIKQIKKPNKKGNTRKEKLSNILLFFYIALFAFIAGGIYTFFFYHLYAQITLLLLVLVTILIIGAATAEIFNTPTYLYSYQTIFPMRIFITPKKADSQHFFMHANIYSIDDEIAFIGSGHFTLASLNSNYESLVEINDTKAVLEISNQIETLFQSSPEGIASVDMAEWGRDIYPEPVR